MNQVSRPMQIMLAGVLVFAALWFVALKPKDDVAEPVAAGPVTPAATTPRPVEAGGAAASSSAGKIVESANKAAATANAATSKSEKQTGDAPAETTPAKAKAPASTTPAATTPAATTPAKAATPAAAAAAAKKPVKKENTRSAAQRRADRVTEAVGKHLAARRAVVVLVSSPRGTEDKILRKRVRSEINRRNGRVRVYLVPVSAVGLYEGLLGSLNLGQTPSTIVIAPNNEAKVMGGLVSTQRIDRLTSAAVLVKPAATK